MGNLDSDQIVIHIASAKIEESKRASHHRAFMGTYPNFSLTFSVLSTDDDLFLKEMRTCVGPRFHVIVFVFDVNQENQDGQGVQDSLA